MLTKEQLQKLEFIEKFDAQHYPGSTEQIRMIVQNVTGKALTEENGLKYFVNIAREDALDQDKFAMLLQKIHEKFSVEETFAILFRLAVLKNGNYLFHAVKEIAQELQIPLSNVLNQRDRAGLYILDYFYIETASKRIFSQNENDMFSSARTPVTVVKHVLELGENGDSFFDKVEANISIITDLDKKFDCNGKLLDWIIGLRQNFDKRIQTHAEQVSSSSSASSSDQSGRNIIVFNSGVLSVLNSTGTVQLGNPVLSRVAQLQIQGHFNALITNQITPEVFFVNISGVYAAERGIQ